MAMESRQMKLRQVLNIQQNWLIQKLVKLRLAQK